MDADFTHAAALWGRPLHVRLVRSVGTFLLYPRIRAVVVYRLSAAAWERRWLRPLALWLQTRAIRSSGAEIHPAARIGPGLQLAHSVGIVIGHEVVAGRDLMLMQGVTLGHRGGPGQPVLGDRVRLMAGCSVLGPVRIGDDAVVGAGAVVLDDVPAGHVAVGVPASSQPRRSAPAGDRP